MAKKVKVAVAAEKFGVFYEDGDCFGTYESLEKATDEAFEDVSSDKENTLLIIIARE